jgi:Tfp pilus assembly protein PilV
MTGAARRGRPHRTAFTLMEVLVAGVVLAAGVVIVLEAIASSLTAGASVSKEIEARSLATDQLSRAARGDLHSLPAEGTESLQGLGYRWSVRRAETDGRLETLVSRVEWSVRGQPRWVEVERLVLPDQEARP